MCLCLAVAAVACGQTPANVSGTVLGARGEPLRKVTLTLYPLASNAVGDPLPPLSATSDTKGGFAFHAIAPGRYRLTAERAGYLTAKFGARNWWTDGTVLDVRAESPLAGLELRMAEQSQIAGTLTGGAYPVVTLWRMGYQDGRRALVSVQTASAEGSGEFSFNKLAPGRYYLSADDAAGPSADPAAERYVTTYYPGTIDRTAAQPIDVRRAESVTGVLLALLKSPVFHVSGFVAAPVLGTTRGNVLLSPVDDMMGRGLRFAPIASNGTFRIEDVSPGAYLLVVNVSNLLTAYIQPAVEISHQSVEGLRLKAEVLPDLHGVWKLEGVAAVYPALTIRLLTTVSANARQRGGVAKIAGDGTFTIAGLSAGRYRATVEGLPADAFVKSARLGERDALAGVDLDSGVGDAKLTIVVSMAGARVTGSVRDQGGKPAGATVTLIPDPPQPANPALHRVVETSADGHFEMRGIRPGKYRLYAWQELEPGAHLDAQFTAAHRDAGVSVEVTEGGRAEVTLSLIPAP